MGITQKPNFIKLIKHPFNRLKNRNPNGLFMGQICCTRVQNSSHGGSGETTVALIIPL